jgi:hypothetical protein
LMMVEMQKDTSLSKDNHKINYIKKPSVFTDGFFYIQIWRIRL